VNDPYSSPERTLESEPKPPRSRSVGQVVFGIVLVGFGLAWLIAATDLFEVPWRAVLSAALIAVGATIAASATRERHGGLVVVGVILTVLLALVSTSESLVDLPLSGGIGERDYRPESLGVLADAYRLGIGEIVVDLTAVDYPAGETRVEASVTLGSLVVTVPDDVAVRIEGHATAGEVQIFGDVHSGTSIDETFEDEGFAGAEVRLVVEASAGLGEVEVRR
jgi:hypothetical protein